MTFSTSMQCLEDFLLQRKFNHFTNKERLQIKFFQFLKWVLIRQKIEKIYESKLDLIFNFFLVKAMSYFSLQLSLKRDQSFPFD
jgi:hypothetical protein